MSHGSNVRRYVGEVDDSGFELRGSVVVANRPKVEVTTGGAHGAGWLARFTGSWGLVGLTGYVAGLGRSPRRAIGLAGSLRLAIGLVGSLWVDAVERVNKSEKLLVMKENKEERK